MKETSSFSASDAWQQLHDLQEKFIMEWEVRSDMDVVADGLERSITINGERHNVGTIRDYIAVLSLACDKVNEWNPEWAGHGTILADPVNYQTCPEPDDALTRLLNEEAEIEARTREQRRPPLCYCGQRHETKRHHV